MKASKKKLEKLQTFITKLRVSSESFNTVSEFIIGPFTLHPINVVTTSLNRRRFFNSKS